MPDGLEPPSAFRNSVWHEFSVQGWLKRRLLSRGTLTDEHWSRIEGHRCLPLDDIYLDHIEETLQIRAVIGAKKGAAS
jgi:hypothetical protein